MNLRWDSRWNLFACDQNSLAMLFEHEQGAIYRRVIDAALAAEVSFALGGGFAINAYTGLARNTKDLDLYVRPDDRDSMIAVLTRLGLEDYYDQLPYDRAWIYRGCAEGAIVDIIWQMVNHRAQVDEGWLVRGPVCELEARPLRLLPPEELLWAKLYVLQRDRCDWPDIFNLIYATGEQLDWEYLLNRINADSPLLSSVLTTFTWLCPGRARRLPAWLWARLGLTAPSETGPEVDEERVRLLDSRPWFSGSQA